MHLRSILIPAVLAIPALAQTAARPAPAAALASAPAKIAILQFQAAVLSTQEGQQAAAGLKSKFDPKKVEIDKKQANLQAMQQKLQQGGATMTPDVRSKMENDIAAGSRALTHDTDDLNAEVQEEEGKIMQVMAQKMGGIIQTYARQHAYTVVLDVSGAQTPVLWAAPSVNITADIVKLYDQAHPAKAAAAPPAKKQ